MYECLDHTCYSGLHTVYILYCMSNVKLHNIVFPVFLHSLHRTYTFCSSLRLCSDSPFSSGMSLVARVVLSCSGTIRDLLPNACFDRVELWNARGYAYTGILILYTTNYHWEWWWNQGHITIWFKKSNWSHPPRLVKRWWCHYKPMSDVLQILKKNCKTRQTLVVLSITWRWMSRFYDGKPIETTM